MVAEEELGAEAIPFPFGEPILGLAEFPGRLVERGSEVKRVGALVVLVWLEIRGGEGVVEIGGRRPLSHEPLGDEGAFDLEVIGEGPDEELFGDADAEAAGEEFIDDKAGGAWEGEPKVAQEG